MDHLLAVVVLLPSVERGGTANATCVLPCHIAYAFTCVLISKTN